MANPQIAGSSGMNTVTYLRTEFKRQGVNKIYINCTLLQMVSLSQLLIYNLWKVFKAKFSTATFFRQLSQKNAV